MAGDIEGKAAAVVEAGWKTDARVAGAAFAKAVGKGVATAAKRDIVGGAEDAGVDAGAAGLVKGDTEGGGGGTSGVNRGLVAVPGAPVELAENVAKGDEVWFTVCHEKAEAGAGKVFARTDGV